MGYTVTVNIGLCRSQTGTLHISRRFAVAVKDICIYWVKYKYFETN